MKVKTVWIVVSFVVMIPCILTAQLDFFKEDAVKAANHWLSMVDAAKYSKSWYEASTFFKSKMSSEKWEQMVRDMREPLGPCTSRKLQLSHHVTTLPDAPEGEYYIMKYKTSFEKKKSVIETVTMMLDEDARWRVSGYYIK
ncbi:MAG: DUF4019 domain-containing protein [Spirochaetota bacterium]